MLRPGLVLWPGGKTLMSFLSLSMAFSTLLVFPESLILVYLL